MSTATAESIRKLSQNQDVRLAGALMVQGGKPALVTALCAKDVGRHAKVDVYDPTTEEGYQRSPTPARIRAVAGYYREGGRMPNPLLGNIREDDFARVRVEITNGDPDGYHEAIEAGVEWVGAGFIEFPRDLPLWIYDGQHRMGGIKQLLEQVPAAFEGFPVPLSITLGLKQDEEMQEFYTVNTNAKSVKTDLAWELLRRLAQRDSNLAAQLEESSKDWIMPGMDVARALETLDGPWADSIQKPNQKMVRGDRLTIGQAGFVRSLKPILEMPLFQGAGPDVIAQVLDSYWKGIKKALPEPFAPDTSPKHWVIQKGLGVVVLHRVLPKVIEVMRARKHRLGDVEAYAEIMQGLNNLSGSAYDEKTGQPILVSGPDFWRVGAKGVAGAFTGESGRKRLFLMVQVELPQPTQEIDL